MPPPSLDNRLSDDVRTIFISGLPEDVKERELQNLLRWLPGYEASQINPKGEHPMGFALFSSPEFAHAAKDALQVYGSPPPPPYDAYGGYPVPPVPMPAPTPSPVPAPSSYVPVQCRSWKMLASSDIAVLTLVVISMAAIQVKAQAKVVQAGGRGYLGVGFSGRGEILGGLKQSSHRRLWGWVCKEM
uniref:RRM domain-containing protein n=1 Tax=Chenopodium quinoa TaxID=63459 RepID=A0A803MP32_CHEQI